VRVSADSFCQGNILSIYELITRVKCSAHQREKEFTEGGIFTRVASSAGGLQRRVKFTFDSRGGRAECAHKGSGHGHSPLLCEDVFLTRSEAELQLMRVPCSGCIALL
jgi:hypothetical protein